MDISPENQTGITIVEENRQVRVTIPGKYGEIQFLIGGDDAEFVHAEGEWTYRSRKYHGQIVYQRGTLQPASGYGFLLKNEKDTTASEAAHKAISTEITAAILAVLAEHPVILSSARHAAICGKLADAEALTDRLTAELAAARQAENTLRNGLGRPPRLPDGRTEPPAWAWEQNGSDWTCGAFTVTPYRQGGRAQGRQLWEIRHEGHRLTGGYSSPFIAMKAAERIEVRVAELDTEDAHPGRVPDSADHVE